MDEAGKKRTLQEDRADVLTDVRARLARLWLRLARLKGLNGPASAVEEAHDVVSRAERVARQEASGEDPDAGRVRAALEEAQEEDRAIEIEGGEVSE